MSMLGMCELTAKNDASEGIAAGPLVIQITEPRHLIDQIIGNAGTMAIELCPLWIRTSAAAVNGLKLGVKGVCCVPSAQTLWVHSGRLNCHFELGGPGLAKSSARFRASRLKERQNAGP